MDARKAADMLCRSYASLTLSNTTTTSISRTALSSAHASSQRLVRPPVRQSCRWLSTQPPPSAQSTAKSSSSSSAARKPGANYDQAMYKSRDTGLPPRIQRTTTTAEPASTFRPRTTVLSRGSEQSKPRSSVDDLYDAANESSRASAWGAPTQPAAASLGSRFSAKNIMFPVKADVGSTPVSKPRVVAELPVHVKPRTGRSISVNPGRANDLGAKLRALDMLVARNRIKSDAFQQKFHERPGLKRKRLASLRWRRNFKARFNGVCARVNDLRVQGW